PLIASPTATGMAPVGSGFFSRRRSNRAVMSGSEEWSDQVTRNVGAARIADKDLGAPTRAMTGSKYPKKSGGGGLQRVGRAELVVLGDGEPLRVDRAGRALRIAVDLVGAEALLEGVVGEQPARQRVTEVEDELDGLQRLDRPDDAGQHAEHPGLRARRRQL